jgi:hypothetical protein
VRIAERLRRSLGHRGAEHLDCRYLDSRDCVIAWRFIVHGIVDIRRIFVIGRFIVHGIFVLERFIFVGWVNVRFRNVQFRGISGAGGGTIESGGQCG